MPDAFIDWRRGQPALSDEQHAGNLRAIWNRLNELFATAGMDVVNAANQSPDGRLITFKSSAGFSFTLTLPPGPFNPAGDRVVGRRYEVDDLVTWQGSSYITTLPHVASVVLDDDLSAGRLQLVAARGADAETSRGPYVGGVAYAASDVVYVGDPLAGTVTFFRAFMDVPADGPAPPTFPWGQVSYQLQVEVTVDVEGKPGPGAVLRRYAVPASSYLLPGLQGWAASLDVAAGAACTYSVRRNGVEIATFAFAAGAKAATFTLAAPVTLAKGDRLTIHAPAAQDGAAAGLALTATLYR